MMTRLLFFILLLSTSVSFGQLTKKPFQKSLHFASDGRLVEPPPKNIRHASELFLTINAEPSKTNTSVQTFLKDYSNFKTLVRGFTDREKILLKNLYSIRHFFETVLPVRNKDCEAGKRFKAEICGAVEFINAAKSKLIGTPPTDVEELAIYEVIKDIKDSELNIQLECLSFDCICNSASRKIDETKTIINELYDYTQTRKLWQDLLCEYRNTDYELYQAVNPDTPFTLYKRTASSALFPLPDSIRLYPSYSVDKKQFTPDIKNNRYTVSHSLADKNGSFAISRRDEYRHLINEWHNKTTPLLHESLVKDLAEKIKLLKQELVDRKLTLNDCSEACDEEKLGDANRLLGKYDTILCLASPVAAYLRSWSWYSKGEFSLNYTGHRDGEEVKKKLKLKENELKDKEELLLKIGELKNCDSCKNFTLSSFQSLQQQAHTIEAAKDLTTKEMEAIKKKMEESASLLRESQVLHALVLPIKRGRHQQYIIWYDGAANFTLRSKKDKLPEDYDIYFGFYNNKKNPLSISIDETKKVFDDTSPFVREVGAATSTLLTAVAGLSPMASGINELLQVFIKSRPADVLEGGAAAPTKCVTLTKEIKSRLWRLALLERLLNSYLAEQPQRSISGGTAGDTTLFTFTNPPALDEPPFTDAYVINYDKTKVARGKFSVGRQKSITVGAGIFYDQQYIEQVEVDTAGATFNVKTSDAKIKYVIGLKVYPFKNFDADGSLAPLFPLHRFSFFGGFEITKPLENLYLGIGYDLVPGLQVSAGFHFYKRNFYTIQNNTILDQTSNYKVSKPYYGLAIDPTVLTNILKSVFSIK